MANKKAKTTKKAAPKKVADKDKTLGAKINEEGLDVVFGALLMGIGEFHGDNIDKLIFVCGVVIFIIGTLLSGNRARRDGKKGLAGLYYFAFGFAIVMIALLIMSELGIHLIP